MYSRQILERKLLLLTIFWLAIMSLPVAGAQNRITFRMDYISGRAAMIIWSPFILDELSGLRRDQPVVPDIAKGESGFLARNPGFVTIICGPKGAAQYGQINYLGGGLCITPLSGHYELFGAPIRAKRTAHASGQILNCLRPLGRV